MVEAFGWGTPAATSLVIGAVIALLFRICPRTIGLIMAFGGGVLISAVAFGGETGTLNADAPPELPPLARDLSFHDAFRIAEDP